MTGQALDIGGSRARLYLFADAMAVQRSEIWLPAREEQESELDWGRRRVEAIADFVRQNFEPSQPTLPTSCAGRKDEKRGSVTLSFYGSPLPDLVAAVRKACEVDLGELYDDDVCAGWGHLVSPRGGLSQQAPPTVLLTAGTGLAECLWVGGEFIPKGSYTHAAEYGLEAPLRAAAWKDGELPLEALQRLLAHRREIAPFKRLVLSGRFAEHGLSWPERLPDGSRLSVCPLEEAPALGALSLSTGRRA